MLEIKHNFFVAKILRNHIFGYKGRWTRLRKSRTTSSLTRVPLSHLRLQGILGQSAQDGPVLTSLANREAM